MFYDGPGWVMRHVTLYLQHSQIKQRKLWLRYSEVHQKTVRFGALFSCWSYFKLPTVFLFYHTKFVSNKIMISEFKWIPPSINEVYPGTLCEQIDAVTGPCNSQFHWSVQLE